MGKKQPAKSSSKKNTAGGDKQFRKNRIICILVFFFIGLFAILGYFDPGENGTFIKGLCGLFKGLTGWGYVVAPPLFLIASVTLFVRTFKTKKRFAMARTIAILAIIVLFGEVMQLITRNTAMPEKPVLQSLWRSGMNLTSGGVIAGGLTCLLVKLLTVAGTYIVLIVVLLVLVLFACDTNPIELFEKYEETAPERQQQKQEIEEERQKERAAKYDEKERRRAEDEQRRAEEARIKEEEEKRKAEEQKEEEERQRKIQEEGARKRAAYMQQHPYDQDHDFAPGDASASSGPEAEKVPTYFNGVPGVPDPVEALKEAQRADAEAAKQAEENGLSPEDEEIPDLAEITGENQESESVRQARLNALRKAAEGRSEYLGTRPSGTVKDRNTSYEIPDFVPDDGKSAIPQFVPAAESAPAEIVRTEQKANEEAAASAGAKRITLRPAGESAEKRTEPSFDEIEELIPRFPPIELLEKPVRRGIGSEDESIINTGRLEEAFHSFGISLNVVNFIHGPNVTRYEAEIEAGTKLSRLIGLEDDIALALGASGVRIAAIPNKISTVGIEVPNSSISTVYLREIIESEAFQNAKSKLSFAIGKNVAGDPVVGNISKLPHLLIAGTTGSGKSVCLNSLILSILYKATPEEVKFIMVDPKMVEFNVYNGIPHMLTPVVTDTQKASGALQYAVVQMEKRYRLFADAGVRELDTYNARIREQRENGMEVENGEILPRLVVVIDELADLMMTAAKDVENSIIRVAQKGRAAGVHLVIATQSPRADVITGLMKANIPSRIAMKVSSSLESRIILDNGGGAEKLMGNGDMLYAPIGSSKPLRIQGTWVSDEEREEVVNFLKNTGTAQYDDAAVREIEKIAAEKNRSKDAPERKDEVEGDDFDELLPQAVDVVLEVGQASTSMLQRRLKLGYSRAARIVDQMEEIGVIGPFEGSKPRQLLITRQQWQEMQLLHGTAPLETLPETEFIPDPEAPDPEYFN